MKKKTIIAMLVVSLLLILSSYLSFNFNLSYYDCVPCSSGSWLGDIFSFGKIICAAICTSGYAPNVIYYYLAYLGIILFAISIILLIGKSIKNR